MKLTPIKTASILGAATVAATQIAPLLPPPYSAIVVAALPLVTLIAGLFAPQPHKKPALPDSKKSARFPTIPPLPVLLMLMLGGCGGAANASVTDARAVTTAVLDCVESAGSAANVHDGLLGCAPPTLRLISTMCAAGVFARGEVCDEVGGLVN